MVKEVWRRAKSGLKVIGGMEAVGKLKVREESKAVGQVRLYGVGGAGVHKYKL